MNDAEHKAKVKIKEMASEFNLTEEQVSEIVTSHFTLARGIIEEANFQAVRIPYFGVFKPDMFLLERKGLVDGTTDSQSENV